MELHFTGEKPEVQGDESFAWVLVMSEWVYEQAEYAK